MKMQLDCLPCFLRQALEASRVVTTDPVIQTRILKEALSVVEQFDSYRHAPEVGRAVHAIVKKVTGIADPYRQIKDHNLKLAQQYYPNLKTYFLHNEISGDRLLKIAALGNTLDAAVYQEGWDSALLDREYQREFAICDLPLWEERLKTARTLLIIGDNAGETVFDRFLIEQLPQLDVTYAVRSGPIINDATVEDALAAGLDQRARIISSGCDSPGLLLDECNAEFLEIFGKADLVISKGQGNYETLSETAGREIFFLLKAKCPVIASNFSVAIGDYVFKALM